MYILLAAGDVINALNGGRDSNRSPSSSPPTSTTTTLPPPSIQKRQKCSNVRFTETVKVHYVDDDGHVLTEDEAICEEPKETYRPFYLGKTHKGESEKFRRISDEAAAGSGSSVRRTLSFPGAGESCDEYETLIDELTLKYGAEISGRFLTGTQTLADTIESTETSPSAPKREAGITFERDFTTQSLALKLVLFLGSGYKSDDVLVRANVRGNVLRVVSNNDVIGQKLINQQPVAPRVDLRFELPVNVDPYKVHAKMDAVGCLTIEAPLVASAPRARVNTFP